MLAESSGVPFAECSGSGPCNCALPTTTYTLPHSDFGLRFHIYNGQVVQMWGALLPHILGFERVVAPSQRLPDLL